MLTIRRDGIHVFRASGTAQKQSAAQASKKTSRIMRVFEIWSGSPRLSTEVWRTELIPFVIDGVQMASTFHITSLASFHQHRQHSAGSRSASRCLMRYVVLTGVAVSKLGRQVL